MKITGKTLEINETVYNLNQINSVRTSRPKITGDAVFIFVSLVFASGCGMTAFEGRSTEASAINGFMAFVWGVTVAAMWVRLRQKQKQLTLFLRTSSGEQEAATGDEKPVRWAANEITKAISTL